MSTSSAWHDGVALAAPPAPTTPLDGRRVDDVVIGAGVIGLGAAISLASHGRDVVVLEAADELGHGTTARSTGKLTLLQGTRLSTITRHLGLDAAQACGLKTHLVDSELHSSPALLLSDQLQINPFHYLLALATEAAQHGADIYCGERAHDVAAVEDDAMVRLDSGAVLRAKNVIVATGLPFIDRSLAFAIAHPQRPYVVAYPYTGGDQPMAVSTGKTIVSTREAFINDQRMLLVSSTGLGMPELPRTWPLAGQALLTLPRQVLKPRFSVGSARKRFLMWVANSER